VGVVVNEHRVAQLLDEAQYHEEHQKWLHAVQIYQQLINEFPEQLDFRIKLGNVYLEMGNLPAAELILLQALSNDSENPDILYSLGIACYQSEDFERALFYMRQLASYRLPKVHYSLGLIYWRRAEFLHAERHLRLTMEFQPDHVNAALALAETCIRQNKFSDAATVLRDISVLVPQDTAVQYLLGTTLISTGEYEDAVLHLRRVLETEPADENARLACAGALIKADRFTEAEEELKTQLRHDERSARTLIAFGKLALVRANRRKAEEYFRRALELEPENTDALEQMRYFTPNGKTTT